jgi:predicted RNA binding protein YcfA (HicA-like mRNA interferase family)
MKWKKFLDKLLDESQTANVDFDSLVAFLLRIGFHVKVKGSHHIFYMKSVEEIVNIQPKNGKAKPYQVRQIRKLAAKYQWNQIVAEVDEQT